MFCVVGSLQAEGGIFACTFDQTGSRFITCEADKTIKIWKEDLQAVSVLLTCVHLRYIEQLRLEVNSLFVLCFLSRTRSYIFV